MTIGLIVVGDEILSGKRRNKHLARVIELLGARGLALAWARFVGDDRARIVQVLREAFGGGDIVFCCGGIGATPDDHTRQAAAQALGVPLELHPQARALIAERMRDVAAEKGLPFEPERADNRHRLNMGCFPRGAEIIPNPYNKIPGFSVGDVHFVPGFPVMAWPMIEALLDSRYRPLHGQGASRERSVVVYGSMEATLTPLMERIEAAHAGIRVFSLPCVDAGHRFGRHIELGVKGPPAVVDAAFAELQHGLGALQLRLGPELVR
ncbi:MAG: competence/damage-inducible protein A [Burkholderiales bacterium]|nr:competence/damage-inducible protein A [Burkholderiales bacterium]